MLRYLLFLLILKSSSTTNKIDWSLTSKVVSDKVYIPYQSVIQSINPLAKQAEAFTPPEKLSQSKSDSALSYQGMHFK
jgi:hypothetical protein